MPHSYIMAVFDCFFVTHDSRFYLVFFRLLNSYFRNQYYRRLRLWFGIVKNVPEDLSNGLPGLFVRMSQSPNNRALFAAWELQLKEFNTVSDMFEVFQAEILEGQIEQFSALFLQESDAALFQELIDLIGLEITSVSESQEADQGADFRDYPQLVFGKVTHSLSELSLFTRQYSWTRDTYLDCRIKVHSNVGGVVTATDKDRFH